MQNARDGDGSGVLTKRHMPSCSNLPNAWNPDIDRYIAYIYTMEEMTCELQMKTKKFPRMVKNQFPFLLLVSAIRLHPATGFLRYLPKTHKWTLTLHPAQTHGRGHPQSCGVASCWAR